MGKSIQYFGKIIEKTGKNTTCVKQSFNIIKFYYILGPLIYPGTPLGLLINIKANIDADVIFYQGSGLPPYIIYYKYLNIDIDKGISFIVCLLGKR